MTDEELRLEALHIALADQDTDYPPLIERAKQIESYVRGAASAEPQAVRLLVEVAQTRGFTQSLREVASRCFPKGSRNA